MAEATPIFGGQHHTQPEAPLESEEVLVLNAFLEVGEFHPELYGLHKDMCAGWTQAWQFCQDHQDKTGKAPAVGLFARSFPSFEVVSGVDIAWAADKLKTAAYERDMRRGLMSAIAYMNGKDLEAAREAILDVAKPNLLSAPSGVSVLDPATVSEEHRRAGWRLPWESLMLHTGGGSKGDFWVLGARLGQGKSTVAPLMAAVAAEQGARVKILSIEMPAAAYSHRVQSFLARGEAYADLRRMLRSPEQDKRRAALTLLPGIPGTIEVFDPSHMRMNIRGVEQAAQDCDLLIVDHVGLLADDKGKRAVEDWRVMAVISNTLKEIALQQHLWLMGLAQVNREAENPHRPPKVSQLSQSDALGQDADVVLTYLRMGERAMWHDLGKNRWGRLGKFYTRFEPENADLTEINADEARSIQMIDMEARASR